LRRNCGKIEAIEEAICTPKAPLEEGLNDPSTTTRNQINENSLVEENFLGGPPVVYWGGVRFVARYPDGKHPEGCRSSE
jgi:hypothetical protein